MNVLICDDDQYVRKMLEKITSNNKKIDNIFTAADGMEAVKTAEEKSIDIALLDIDMPKLDGIEAAKIISKATPKTYFVFITAHMEYAIDSFCVHPYDYLLKPIDIEGFEKTLEELVDLIQNRSLNEKDKKIDKLAIKEDGEIYFVLMNDILYFEKIDRQVLVHTTKDIHAINKTLRALEKDLNNNFIKTHQSFIVNKEKIKKIEVDGIEFEEYYYKVKIPDISGIKSRRITRPEEGDYRVTIAKGDPSGKDWFGDDVVGYLEYLNTQGVYDGAHIYAYLISNPIANYFTNKAIDWLEEGHKGKGTAYSIERRVHKWGQIYHNNRWVDYYYGKQDEVYWGQKIYVLSTDEDTYGDILYVKTIDYGPEASGGYNPIYVDATEAFRDLDEVYELAYGQYEHNAYLYRDSGSDIDWTHKWEKGVEPMYTDK